MYCFKKKNNKEKEIVLFSFVSEVGVNVVTMDCFGLGKVEFTYYALRTLGWN